MHAWPHRSNNLCSTSEKEKLIGPFSGIWNLMFIQKDGSKWPWLWLKGHYDTESKGYHHHSSTRRGDPTTFFLLCLFLPTKSLLLFDTSIWFPVSAAVRSLSQPSSSQHSAPLQKFWFLISNEVLIAHWANESLFERSRSLLRIMCFCWNLLTNLGLEMTYQPRYACPYIHQT